MAVEPHAKAAGFISSALAMSAGYLATEEADMGNREAAAAALAANRRLIDVAIRDLPPDSYARSFLPELHGYYGFPNTGTGFGAYAPAFAAGDYEEVRNLARASAKRLEQLKPPGPQQELDRDRMLQVAYRTQAEASYRLKDFAAAEAEIKKAFEVGRKIPRRVSIELRDENAQWVLAAMIAARSGKSAEAQAMIEPVLKFHRELNARPDNDDQSQRIEYAQALYAAALAGSASKSAQLAEAAAIVNALPPEMRHLISTARLRDAIAEEQRARH